jgi:hypothetical protein
MADLPGGLLDAVKLYLNITWQDDATDTKVTGYINRGMALLRHIAGAPSLDFTAEDLPRTLLLDYCRYANSQALEVFEQNFQSDLLELNLRTQAPVIAGLIPVLYPGTIPGSVAVKVTPWRSEENSYVYLVGTGLVIPARMDTCAPPAYTEWDGFSPIPAVSGQDVLIVEVNDEYDATRAGKVTVIL